MSDLRMRLQHRRQVVRLHHISQDVVSSHVVAGGGGDLKVKAEEKKQLRLPFLTFLTDDPALSSQLQVYVALGQRLRVGLRRHRARRGGAARAAALPLRQLVRRRVPQHCQGVWHHDLRNQFVRR